MSFAASERPGGTRTAVNSPAVRRVAVAVAIVCFAIAAGRAVATGGKAEGAVLLLGAAPFLLVLAEQLRYSMILIWVVFEGIATPFIRYPSHQTYVTFDRLWIPLAVVALIWQATQSSHSRTTRRLAVALALFVACTGIRAVFTGPSTAQRYALGIWVDAFLLPAVVYYLIRAAAFTEQRVRQLAGAFALAGAILGATTLLERLLGFQLASRSGGAVFVDSAVGIRYSGPYAQPDMLAVALLICLAMTLLWTQLRRSPPLVVALPAVLLELAGIWLTYFRGAWIATLVVFIVSFGLRPRRFARLAGVGGFVALIAVVAFLQLGDSQSSVAARLNNGQNIVGRLATYKEGLQLFAQHPVFGVGIAKYSDTATSATTVTVNGVAAASTAHNDFINVLVEQGLVGASLLAVVTFAVWRLIHRLRRIRTNRTDILLGACVTAATLAYLVIALEETTILQAPPNILFAAVLGVAAARLDAALVAPDPLSRSQHDQGVAPAATGALPR